MKNFYAINDRTSKAFTSVLFLLFFVFFQIHGINDRAPCPCFTNGLNQFYSSKNNLLQGKVRMICDVHFLVTDSKNLMCHLMTFFYLLPIPGVMCHIYLF